MVKILSTLVIALAISPCLAWAQDGHRGTAQQQRACRSDVARFCRGGNSDAAIADCLRSNADRLRPACRTVIQGG